MEFRSLGLAEPIVRTVSREGYTHPTPIQTKAIPHVLAGRDLLGCAQTGTGKTAAFALPIIHRLSASTATEQLAQHRKPRRPRALVLAPTRELASQIGDSFRAYSRGLPLKYTTIYGGISQNPQVRAVKAGVDVLIATPGRLMDLMNQRHIDLRAIEIFVLDEADRMLDMGFIPDIRKIIANIPTQRQTLLFSATMPLEIRRLADSILRNPVSVQVDPAASAATAIVQSVYHVPLKSKPALLQNILQGEASGRTLVFTRTKHGADRVVKNLIKGGIRAEAIHGNKSQNARTRALTAFKSKSPPVLVATDIASRGIDVDDISHVINFDMPIDAETYIHRIGRTARAGASGIAVSFCDRDERGKLRAIERLTGTPLTVRDDQPELTADAADASDKSDRHPSDRSGGNRRHSKAASAHGSTRTRRGKSPRRAMAKSSSTSAKPERNKGLANAGGGKPRSRDDDNAAGAAPGKRYFGKKIRNAARTPSARQGRQTSRGSR